MSEYTVKDFVEALIGCRDKLEAIKKEYEEKKAEWVDRRDKLEGIIQQFMQENQLDNLKTEAGTCYTTVKYTASLADPDAFMTYVIANQRYDLLDRRANVTAVRDFTERTKVPPPGVNLTSYQSLNVRRA